VKQTVVLHDADDVRNAWERIQGERAAHEARLGDWGRFLERRRERATLGEAERAVLVDLFDGKLVATKVKVDKRRVPKRKQLDLEADVLNFVINRRWDGRTIKQAVDDAEAEPGFPTASTIWALIRRQPLVFKANDFPKPTPTNRRNRR